MSFRVEEYLRVVPDVGSFNGTPDLDEETFWSIVLRPIMSAMDYLQKLCHSEHPETDVSQEELREFSLREIEKQLRLGELYVSVSQRFSQPLLSVFPSI